MSACGQRACGQPPTSTVLTSGALQSLAHGLSSFCDPVVVAQKVAAGVYKGCTTKELDELAAETAASLTSSHPHYATLAARIAVSNLHKSTSDSFVETCVALPPSSRPAFTL